jgi:putative membrane protein
VIVEYVPVTEAPPQPSEPALAAKRRFRARLQHAIVGALSLGLFAYLVVYVGFDAVFSAALTIGWGGFAILVGYGLMLFVLLGIAWRVLIAQTCLPRLTIFVWGRMVRDAAGDLLPFSQLGGFIVGARAAILNGIAPPTAFASTVVDVTTEMMAQVAFVALGIYLLVQRAPESAFAASLTGALTAGIVIMAVSGGIFLILQRRGLWIAERFAPGWLRQTFTHTTAFAASLEAIHRAPLRIATSMVLHFAGWIGSAIATWIALRLIGVDAGIDVVIALEALICAVRSAAFAVPGALGVQEAGYAVLAPLFGIGAEIGIAISLLKRARDIAIGIPALLAWQAMEGRHALARQAAKGNTLES